MTKLEEKLIELGYRQSEIIRWFYVKEINREIRICISLNCEFNEIEESYLDCYVSTQEELDNVQQAFNILQKDLEVLENDK